MQRQLPVARLVELVGSATATGPAYRGLADGIRLSIADGRIPSGVRLPSERDLTRALGVSRTTVTRAYGLLRDLGYLAARQGSGTVAVLPGPALRRPSTLTPGDGDAGVIDLTCAALTAPPGFQAAAEAAVAVLPGYLAGRGYHPLGLPELRERVAGLYTDRGLATDPDQVMITSGALAAFAATARALLGPGDRILMESPTYPNAIETARRSGARPVALPVDPDGWNTAAMIATLRQTAPRVAYLIPDFHNPTGALMPDQQRQEIGRALRSTHTVPVVDETVAEMALDEVPATRPMGAFLSRTVTIGGASKTYWGGLRIGWLRAPRDLLGPIADARLTLDLSASLLDQLVQLELFDRRTAIIDHRRLRVRASRDALVAALAEHLPDWSVNTPAGGLSVWVGLPDPMSTALTVAAERHGVLLAPGALFAVEGGMERFVRLPYADHDPDVLDEAVRRLALAWAEARGGQSGRRSGTRLVA